MGNDNILSGSGLSLHFDSKPMMYLPTEIISYTPKSFFQMFNFSFIWAQEVFIKKSIHLPNTKPPFLTKIGQHSWGYLLVVLTKLQIHFDPCKSHNDWCAAPGPLAPSQSHLVCPVWSLNSVTCQQQEIVGNLDHCHVAITDIRW